ncbi:MAG: type II toxin-antitoxin system HicA family toxin [Bacteroidota bacterium]
MSNKLPIVKIKLLEKVLLYLGFEIKRQKGSHVKYLYFMRMQND